MEKTIAIMEGTKVEVNGNEVVVSGKKGELKRKFHYPKTKIEKKDNIIIARSDEDKQQNKAVIGTWIAHIKNMMIGVNEGYSAKMAVIHRHFPIAVKIQGKELVVQNIRGQKNPIKMKIRDDVDVKVSGESISITGVDKESVGNTVSQIEALSRVGSRTDRRVFYDGIYKVDE